MNYKVVIVGGGPAGISCAIQLQKMGIPNCVIDKNTFPRKKLCGGLITEKTYNLISDLLNDKNDLANLFSNCCNVNKVAFYEQETLIAEVNTKKTFRIIDRELFDYSLVNYYVKIGGVFYSGEEIASIDFTNKSILLKTRREFCYEVLVAADGANSYIRKHTFKRIKNIGFCLETEISQKRKNEIGIYFNVLKGGYGWNFPTSFGSRIGFGNSFRKGYKYRDLFFGFLSTKTSTDSFNIVGAHVPYGGCLRKPFFEDSVIFIGDAAGFVDPIYGEGLYYSFLSGRYAAKSIVEDIARTTYLYRKYSKNITNQILWGNIIKKVFFSKLFQKLFIKKLFKHKDFLTFYLDNQVSLLKYKYSNPLKMIIDYKKEGKKENCCVDNKDL